MRIRTTRDYVAGPVCDLLTSAASLREHFLRTGESRARVPEAGLCDSCLLDPRDLFTQLSLHATLDEKREAFRLEWNCPVSKEHDRDLTVKMRPESAESVKPKAAE